MTYLEVSNALEANGDSQINRITVGGYFLLMLTIGALPILQWQHINGLLMLIFLLILVTMRATKDPIVKSYPQSRPNESWWAVSLRTLMYVFMPFVAIVAVSLVAAGNHDSAVSSTNTATLSRQIMNSPAMMLMVLLIAPYLEEVVFRQSVFSGVTKWLHVHLNGANENVCWWIAAILTGWAFGMMHEDSVLLVYVLFSIYLQWIYHRERDLRFNIVTHMGVNTLTFCLLLWQR